MTRFSLILRSLKYYRKSYLAVMAGTILSTAVLTGALVVGDSVRHSLSKLTDTRLGKTRFAIQSKDRYFRQELAADLARESNVPVSPILATEGIALNPAGETRISRAIVLGIDESFPAFWPAPMKIPGPGEALISASVAKKLNLERGDEISLKLRRQSKASENAPFVSEKESPVVMSLKVIGIATDEMAGRYSLKSNQSPPFNIFVSLPSLSNKIGLKGLSNNLLIADDESNLLSVNFLDSMLKHCWQAEDAGLRLTVFHEKKLLELRSDRVFIDNSTAALIRKTFPLSQPIFTYLVNSLSHQGKSTPYSFVSAVGDDYHGLSPGPGDIIINDWLAKDLQLTSGDSVMLRYYKMGALRSLTEDSARFCVSAVLPVTNAAFDPSLMPDFPGMTDAGNCRDWETGAPVDLGKIRDKDEEYWNDYRGTPKALLSLEAGQELWDNPFGTLTAIRFSGDSTMLPSMRKTLAGMLEPNKHGLVVEEVYQQGKSAAMNATDFGSLFLSLSFFIILAALLLSALLYSRHARQRLAETALLLSMGFRRKDIDGIMFSEVGFTVLGGGILGVWLGIGYNKLMLLGLNTLWVDAVRTDILQVHINPMTLLIGFIIGIDAAVLVLYVVYWRNLRKPLSSLLKGAEPGLPALSKAGRNVSFVIAITSLVSAGGIILYGLAGGEGDQSTPFLAAGGLVLLGGLSSLYCLLVTLQMQSRLTVPGFFMTVLKNISLKRRSALTAVAFLAIGTFTVFITGANHKTFYGTEAKRGSGTGGFLFWAETTVPILEDLNSPEGKEKLNLADETDLASVHYFQCLKLDGNDASCLNLNQVSQPSLLGVDQEYLNKQQAFVFSKLTAGLSEKSPWTSLGKELAPGVIPGFADQSVIQWGLRKKLGDTLIYTTETGKSLKIVLVGGLDNSVFQGHVLVSEALLRRYYPSASGGKVMLIDGEYEQRSAIAERLEYLFEDHGLMLSQASERLAMFNSVENTYLTVFMMLGGLAMLIGTIGLGIVLLRNLAERSREIALYRALGLQQSLVWKLLFTEYLFILLSGMGIGLLAALAGILPSFISPSFELPGVFLFVLFVLILISGLLWIYFPLRAALKKELLSVLRGE